MKKFIRSNFFPFKNSLNIQSLNDLLSEEIVFTNFANNFEIKDISSLSTIRNDSLIFFERVIKSKNYQNNDLHIITDKLENKNYYKNITIVKNLSLAYNKILNHLFFHEDQIDFPDNIEYLNGSYISKYANIDKSSKIGKNCFISRGVQIGKNTIIKNNVVIKNSIIGNNVIIGDNTSIGTTGFGFDTKKRGSIYLNPQIGITFIDDNVNIGALCTVDRGKIDLTSVGKNTMIDNMVHLAHNVIIGDNVCIAAQTGISGSVVIENNVTVGGQAGFAGHINIGKNSVIAAKSGVTKNIKENSVVAGFPAIDIKVWKRNLIKQRKYGH